MDFKNLHFDNEIMIDPDIDNEGGKVKTSVNFLAYLYDNEYDELLKRANITANENDTVNVYFTVIADDVQNPFVYNVKCEITYNDGSDSAVFVLDESEKADIVEAMNKYAQERDNKSLDSLLLEARSYAIEYNDNTLSSFYTEIFSAMLETMEFSLDKHYCRETNSVSYSLYDLQGANLGDVQSEEFCNATEIIDRLDTYLGDYYFNDLEDECNDPATSDFTADDWVQYLDAHDDLKASYLHEYDVMKMISSYSDKVNVDIAFRDCHTPDGINHINEEINSKIEAVNAWVKSESECLKYADDKPYLEYGTDHKLDYFALSDDADDRIFAAQSQYALYYLAYDKEYSVRLAVAENCMPDHNSTLALLAEDNDSNVREAVAKKTSSPEILDKLAYDNSSLVRMAVVLNTHISDETLIHFACGDENNSFIRGQADLELKRRENEKTADKNTATGKKSPVVERD